MDMMNGIASMSMDLSAAKVSQQYSLSVTKKVMDTQELAGQELLRMLPDVPKGEFIDTYA